MVGVVLAGPGASATSNPPEKVIIKDPTSSAQAKVSSDGALRVSDGSGPMTVDGNVNVSDGSGPITVDGQVGITGTVALGGPVAIAGPVEVTGTVTAESPVQLSQYFHTFFEIHDGASRTYTPPSGQSLVVTSIQIAANVVNEPFAAASSSRASSILPCRTARRARS